jgi:hypothetical protein
LAHSDVTKHVTKAGSISELEAISEIGMGKLRHVVTRNGRHYARMVVPAKPPELRQMLGATELREPLGADKRAAARASHAAVARLQERINEARRQLARAHYARALARDDDQRVAPGHQTIRELNSWSRPVYAAHLRRLTVGRTDDEEAEALMGWAADEAVALGESDARRGAPERRELLQMLAGVHLDALAQAEERDQGIVAPRRPLHPLLADQPAPLPSPTVQNRYGRGAVMSSHSTKPLSELLAPILQMLTLEAKA